MYTYMGVHSIADRDKTVYDHDRNSKTVYICNQK